MAKYAPYKLRDKLTVYCPIPTKIEQLNISAKLFLIFTIKYGCNLRFLKLDKKGKQINNLLHLYQGNFDNCSNHYCNRINAECIIAFLIINNYRILIPGDSTYECWPITFKPTHLILPHHGCYYDNIIECNKQLKKDNIKKLFVFTGFNKKYKHPQLCHLKLFKKYAKIELFGFDNTRAYMFKDEQIIELKDGDELVKILPYNKKYINWKLN